MSFFRASEKVLETEERDSQLLQTVGRGQGDNFQYSLLITDDVHALVHKTTH